MEIENLFTFSWLLFHIGPFVWCFVVRQTENKQYQFPDFIDCKFDRLILGAYLPVVSSFEYLKAIKWHETHK